MVYLDHWALNDIALCDAYRRRFTSILNDRGGMLRISAYSIRELANQGDKSEIDAILSFLDEIDIGFINIHPTEVIERENQIISGNQTVGNPSADLEIINLYLMAMNHPQSWSIAEIVKTCLANTNTSSFCSEDFLTKITSATGKARSDMTTTERMKKHFNKLRAAGQQHCAATREFLKMAIAFIIINQSMKMTVIREWNDLFHVIVPVAYCDIVLVDKRWKEFIKQTGLKAPGIAHVYDKHTIEDFFKTIENGCYS
jgi:hypothetical protein